MKYTNMIEGTFVRRDNRFIAKVQIDGQEETVHVKNTGRCKELLIPGVKVYLQCASDPNRKTKWDLISVEKAGRGIINIDSQVPNKVVAEWLKENPEFEDAYIKPEFTYGNSRFDFYLEIGDRKIFMEVKGCTLEVDGQGYFPDAPTERGAKHLRRLAEAIDEGYEVYLVYCIAINGVISVLPNVETDPGYADAIEYAKSKGVKVIYLPCRVTADEIVAVGAGN